MTVVTLRNRFVKSLRAAFWLLGGLGALTPAAMVAAESDLVQRFPAQATVRFAATSTLHDFDGQLPAQPFFIVVSNGTWSADAGVLAAHMATASEGRDRNMHKMLGTNEHPLIRGVVVAAPLPGAAGTNVTLRLKIRDRSQDLPVRISDWKETGSEIQFHAAWELSLKQFALKPPSVIGVIRVGDRVKLEADVTATKSASSPPDSTNSP